MRHFRAYVENFEQGDMMTRERITRMVQPVNVLGGVTGSLQEAQIAVYLNARSRVAKVAMLSVEQG